MTARTIDRSSWLIQLCLVLVHLANDRPKMAMRIYFAMCSMVGDLTLPMPSVGLLAIHRATNGEMNGIPSEFERPLSDFLTDPDANHDAVQCAILNIDIRPEFAVVLLGRALSLKEPLIWLVPYCPLFDPLKKLRAFRVLCVFILMLLKE